MNEAGFAGITSLAKAHVAVIGLGLMGGSLALALRGQCAFLTGYDPDPQVLRLAEQQRVVDLASPELEIILPDADLVVLAAPVLAILDLLKDLDRFHPAPAVVLDLGSTKAQIVAAMANLPIVLTP